MVENKDQGNPEEEIVQFEDLDLENDKEKEKEKDKLSRGQELATFLKEKLSDEDYSSAAKILGIAESEDLSNAELLEQLTELFEGEKKPEEEEEEDDKKKPKEEEEDMADYKTFIKECTEEGKTLAECAAEWKKKYPEPKKKESEGLEKDEEFTVMENRIKELEEKNRVAEITTEVSELVHAKHLSPRQKEPVIKLSASMDPELKEEFLGLFRTQTYAVSEDKGTITQKRPGDTSLEIDVETRARIMKEHGLDSLIADKAVKPLNN